jgi:hypothetical protein
VHVAGSDHGPSGRYADLGLFEIALLKPNRIKHGAAGGAFGAIDHLGGKFAELGLGGVGGRRFHSKRDIIQKKWREGKREAEGFGGREKWGQEGFRKIYIVFWQALGLSLRCEAP